MRKKVVTTPAKKSALDKLKFAVSCSSNMNRSMEAHGLLMQRGFLIESYGSGNQVKLPGTAIDKPNCYEFGPTTYEFIYKDLKAKDEGFYKQNGLLSMLDRNKRIKERPQKFQLDPREFDIVVCLEERVYDQVVDHLHGQPQGSGNAVHVINIDIEDNPEEATIGALFVRDICAKLDECEDVDNQIDEVLANFEATNPKRNILHTVCFY